MKERLNNNRMAKKDFKNRNHINKLKTNYNIMTTKANYVSSLRNWAKYCIEYNEDPFQMPIDPLVVIYWFSERALQAGSVASICTWQSSLSWLCKIKGFTPSFKENYDFSTFKKELKKEYAEESDTRLPFDLNHIFQYTKHYKCYGKHLKTIPLHDYLKVLLAQLYFCSMARPCELTKIIGNESKPGLKLGDIYHNTDASDPNEWYFALFILSFKNQKSKKYVKKIIIGNSKCGNRYIPGTFKICPCNLINPYQLLFTYLKRCQQIALNSETFSFTNKDPVFRFKNGISATTKFVGKIAKEIAKLTKEPEPKRLTGYSFRIGGATLSCMQQIPQPKLLKYVGWKPSHLPHVSMRYMRYKEIDFKTFIFELIHGSNEVIHRNLISSFKITAEIYDPWTTDLDRKKIWD